MKIQENVIKVRDYLTKSKLPSCDYVINPYVGCPHACQYCYASFMKRFTGHQEEWGSFIDVKQCDTMLNARKLTGKSVFLSSVTDCYNSYEEKYRVTRKLLEQLVHIPCSIGISTKSKLILRDMDLLSQCEDLKVSMSVNTLDEGFKTDMDQASSIRDRLDTLKELHGSGIYTILFMSPMFPYITDFKSILEQTKDYIDEYWFENLNLRGSYKGRILEYINRKYPDLYDNYKLIYNKGDKNYWVLLAAEIEEYCEKNHIKHRNYFYHEELVRNKQKDHII